MEPGGARIAQDDVDKDDEGRAKTHLQLHLDKVIAHYAALCRRSRFFVGLVRGMARDNVAVDFRREASPAGSEFQHLPNHPTEASIAEGNQALVRWMVAQARRGLSISWAS